MTKRRMSVTLGIATSVAALVGLGCETKRDIEELTALEVWIRVDEQVAPVRLQWQRGDCVRLTDHVVATIDGQVVPTLNLGRWSWRRDKVTGLPFRDCPSWASFGSPLSTLRDGRVVEIRDSSAAVQLNALALLEPLVWGPLEHDEVHVGDEVRLSWTPESHFCREPDVFFHRNGETLAPRDAVRVLRGKITFNVPLTWVGEGELRVITMHQAHVQSCTANTCTAFPPQSRDGFSGRLRVRPPVRESTGD